MSSDITKILSHLSENFVPGPPPMYNPKSTRFYDKAKLNAPTTDFDSGEKYAEELYARMVQYAEFNVRGAEKSDIESAIYWFVANHSSDSGALRSLAAEIKNPNPSQKSIGDAGEMAKKVYDEFSGMTMRADEAELSEDAFRPEILAALQALHAKLQNKETDFEDGKIALVSYINKWTVVPGVKRDLISDIKFHVRDNDALMSEVERILMVFGGTPALQAVAETSDEDPDMDKDMQELKAGSKYMGVCPICKKPITGRITKKDPTTGKETVDKEADKVEYWHGKKAHAECVAAEKEKEKEGKKEPEPAVATEMSYEEIDAKLLKLGEEDTSIQDTKALHDKLVQDAKDQFGDETDEFDIEAAIYWLASDYHSGQSSPLYSILSMSQFKPGPSHGEVKDEGEMAEMIYDYLKNEYIDVKGKFVYEEFSRQHYEVIANVIKTARDKDEIAAALADLFGKDNPRFDRARFLKASGIEVD